MLWKGFKQAPVFLKLYLQPFRQNRVGGRELVELSGWIFRHQVALNAVADELLPTLDPNGPTYPRRMQHHEKIRQAMVGLVSGGLTTLSEHRDYQTEDLKRFIEYMDETFPDIVPRVSEANQAVILKRLADLQTNPEMEKFQPGLGQLQEKVRAAIEAQKSAKP